MTKGTLFSSDSHSRQDRLWLQNRSKRGLFRGNYPGPRPIFALLLAIAYISFSGAIQAQETDKDFVDDFHAVEVPTESKQKKIDSLFSEMSYEQSKLQKLYQDLEDAQLIDSSGRTMVTLSDETQTIYGSRYKFLVNERAVVTWKNKQIMTITFHQRKGLMGTGNILKRRLVYYVQPEKTDVASQPIDFTVSEFVNTDKGDNVNFRYPAASGPVRDHKEVVNLNGIKREMMVIYIRDVESRIEVLEENLRLLKFLRRRLNWLLKYQAESRKNKIRRFIEF